MALNKIQLKQDLRQLASDMLKRTNEQVDTTEEWAERLATIVDAYIRSATIRVSGVVTAGSATTQTQTIPVTASIQ